MRRLGGFGIAVVLWWSAGCGSSALSEGKGDAAAAAAPDAGGGDDAGGDALSNDAARALAGFEGIYAIQDVTMNPASCTVEGPSVLASQTSRLFAAVVAEPGGSPILSLVACTAADDCIAKADMERNGSVSGAPWVYSVRGTGPGNGDDTVFTGPAGQSQCTGETLQHATLTGDAGGTLRIQIQITDVPAHDAVGGTCSATATEQAAAGVPCTRLEVITGSYQQPL
jgi:hypothetical protein